MNRHFEGPRAVFYAALLKGDAESRVDFAIGAARARLRLWRCARSRRALLHRFGINRLLQYCDRLA
jgi:hypothetical protein